MTKTREFVRQSRLERAEAVMMSEARHIEALEKRSARQDQALEYLFALLEQRTLRGRWRRLVRWLGTR